MPMPLPRRHFMIGAATAGAAAATLGLATPARATAPAAIDGVRAAGPAAVTATTRIAPFPVGYSTGSSMLFESKENIAKTLDIIVDSGGTSVRFDIMWVLAQPTEKTFAWGIFDYAVAQARARNLTILAIITTCPDWAAQKSTTATSAPKGTTRPATAAAYAKFAGIVASRYKSKILAYEIWNEPNSPMSFSPTVDPTFYGQMVKAAYPVIKAADPAVTVIAGALGPAPDANGWMNPITFVKALYAAGAAGSFDAFSFHPYDYSLTLAGGTLYDGTAARRMVEIHALMKANGDGDKKIWITEYGAPTGGSVTEEKQESLIRNSLTSWGEVSYAGPFYIFTVTDISNETFGLTTSSFVAKKALATVRSLQASGLPYSGRGTAFRNHAVASLGATVSVSYPIGTGAAQDCENGTLYQTPNGWFTSPVPVASIARQLHLVPKTAFVDGYQDFDINGGIRVFYTAKTGVHAIGGAILTAWTPSLGVATTDEYEFRAADKSRANDFERGRVVWSPKTGTTVTRF